jgi:hypothetical protein
VLAALAFVALDLALVAIAFRRPWAALVLLLAGLPLSGLTTQVIPRILNLSVPAELALAAWRDGVLAGIVLAAGVALVRSSDRRLRPIEWLVLAALLLGAAYVAFSPVPLTAVYVYRVLYEPPLLLAAVLVLARVRGMPAWVAPRAALAFVVTSGLAAIYVWPQVYMLKFAYLQRFYTDPGERIHHSFLASGLTQPRGIGTLTSPNEFGAVLAIAIVLLLTPGLVPLRRHVRPTLVVVLGLALLLSFSRSGWLAAVIGVGAMAIVSRPAWPSRAAVGRSLAGRRDRIAVFAPLLVGVLIAATVLATSGGTRLVERTATGGDPSAGNRPRSALAGLAVLRDHPLGLGLGTAGPKAARFQELAGRPRILTETWYVLYAIQVGVLGFALLVALTLAILRGLWIARGRPVARAAIGFGLGLAVGALFIPIIEDPAVFIPLWAFAGLGVAGAAEGVRIVAPRAASQPAAGSA